jgi:hypothetical protein
MKNKKIPDSIFLCSHHTHKRKTATAAKEPSQSYSIDFKSTQFSKRMCARVLLPMCLQPVHVEREIASHCAISFVCSYAHSYLLEEYNTTYFV